MSKLIEHDQIVIEHLKNDKDFLKEYIDATLEEFLEDKDEKVLMSSLKLIVEAKGGIGKLSKVTKLNRENLYKVFSGKVSPKFKTITLIMEYLGSFSMKLNPSLA